VEVKENDRLSRGRGVNFCEGECGWVGERECECEGKCKGEWESEARGVVYALRLCPGPGPAPLCGMGARTVIPIDGGVLGAYIPAGVGDTDLDLICTGELGSDRKGLDDEEGDNDGDDGENISFMRRFFIAMRTRMLALRFGLEPGLGLGLEVGLSVLVGAVSVSVLGVLIEVGVGVGVTGNGGNAPLGPCLPCCLSSLAWRSLVPLVALLRSTPQRARKRARQTVLSVARTRHVRETAQQPRRVASAVWAYSCSWGIGRWVEAME
jgi:hypothetical protein